jgi:hypothetical protein
MLLHSGSIVYKYVHRWQLCVQNCVSSRITILMTQGGNRHKYEWDKGREDKGVELTEEIISHLISMVTPASSRGRW